MTDREPDVDIDLPRELVGGVYANFLFVWHSPFEFTLDFCVLQPRAEEEARPTVVSRVRIPVAIIFDVIRGLNESMTRYEEQFGEIRPPKLSSEGE
jgi:hypothetical protein